MTTESGKILILHFVDELAKKPQAVPYVVPELRPQLGECA
jgi:hypothetical protein